MIYIYMFFSSGGGERDETQFNKINKFKKFISLIFFLLFSSFFSKVQTTIHDTHNNG